MSTTHINTPTSVLKLGHASGDITPPVGIYHRMWGAAQHDAATGVHRPIQADVILLEPIDASASDRVLRLQLDLVNLTTEQMDRLAANTGEAADINPERVLITFSHSHASGFYAPNRRNLPGGDLIDPYLDDLNRTAARLAGEALENLSESTITYAFARCDMARNRDYRDEQVGIYATGYNPDRTGDDTLLIGRVTGSDEEIRLIIVSYGCHPTTLAWDNTLISPDYIGALREVIETDTNAPCCFFQAPSGDLGPRDGFVGDLAVADRNGKQVGHAALSALYGMGAPRHDFAYAGPVVSGATIGTWAWDGHSEDRINDTRLFQGGTFDVELNLIDLPTQESLQKDIARYIEEQTDAAERGDKIAARDLGARAERCRRWMGRLETLPEGKTFPYHFSVFQFGDAVWVTCSAEPYSWLQIELRKRFPDLTLMVSSLAGDHQVAYLLPRKDYGKGLYQEEPSSLAPGCLEALADAITARIEEVTGCKRK
ncbi:MAG TPA: hypothetical protein DHW45_12470 [Candidatus Latescibacteria bacterium]|jgi:hypothetical protein|nr:hypothetical protein [Candidatus Latescibacterota bacterium]